MPILSLESYKDFHKGQDIYVVASGASVDHVDPKFLEDKITIGINEIYKKMRTTYLIRKDPALLRESLEKNPTTLHFITRGQFGGGNSKNYEFVVAAKDLAANPIVIFDHNVNIHDFPKALPNSGLVTSYSTITTAIHLAAYMGAKTILLVGHDCGTLDGKVNCDGYYTPQNYQIAWKGGESEYKRWVPTIESHTIALKALIKEKYGAAVHSINPFINFGLEGHKYSKS